MAPLLCGKACVYFFMIRNDCLRFFVTQRICRVLAWIIEKLFFRARLEQYFCDIDMAIRLGNF